MSRRHFTAASHSSPATSAARCPQSVSPSPVSSGGSHSPARCKTIASSPASPPGVAGEGSPPGAMTRLASRWLHDQSLRPPHTRSTGQPSAPRWLSLEDKHRAHAKDRRGALAVAGEATSIQGHVALLRAPNTVRAFARELRAQVALHLLPGFLLPVLHRQFRIHGNTFPHPLPSVNA